MSPSLPRRSTPADDAEGVRALLASLPDPGPMPPQVSERIAASLAREPRFGGSSEVPPNVVPLRPVPPPPGATAARRGPSGRLLLGLSAAAAAVAVAGVAGTQALAPGVEDSSLAAALAARTGGTGTAAGGPMIELSKTAYTSGDFSRQAAQLRGRDAHPVAPMTAESPHVGPIATPQGVEACLSSLGEKRARSVRVDVALFDGRPAAVVLLDRGGVTTAQVVSRACGAPGEKARLHGPIQLP